MILSVGSLIPLKGFQTIIEALPGILRNDNSIELHIIGEGSYRDTLSKLALSKGVSGHVFFAGYRPNSELVKWYNAADLFCLASFREGWPNVVMEALSCGTPVVATRVFGTPEILTSSDLGILVDPTPESIRNGLLTAFKRDWDRQRICTHMATHTWQNIAGKINLVFHEILSQELEHKKQSAQYQTDFADRKRKNL